MEDILTGIEGKGGAYACLMKPKILSWNMRMLNKKEKIMWIKGLIRDQNANIVCLQETN
jgi:hypothetical protein